ncbi:hypothetical protein [Nonomuraea ceibae]|uniref:hypothetical protein n=1 Tax=Nonomuraea ceibae TaxID=1935170 RepID=UPI001C605A22|nr:hypothetical protein [Nonomuraea ceibae]
MGCGCGKGRQQFEVVSADGKVVDNSTSKTTAEAVAKRYDGTTVWPKEPAANA